MINYSGFLFFITFVAQVLILWGLIYFLLNVVSASYKAALIVKGLILIFFASWLAAALELQVISYIFSQITTWIWWFLIIIFAPELRSAIEKLGRGKIENYSGKVNSEDSFLNDLKESLVDLSKTKTGALITIEKSMLLDTYYKSGIQMDSMFSKELILSIFNVKSPLHDGAIIVRGNKILASNVYYPINRELKLSKTLGTRHRAALSISEITDSITFIVSEETSAVSIAYLGRLYYDLDPETVIKKFKELVEAGENNE